MVEQEDNEKLEQVFRQHVELPIIDAALRRLEEGLPDELYFHSRSHTESVIRETLRFALGDGLSERDVHLLAIAAAYHDTGFLERVVDNEAVGARLAREALEADGSYSEDEIKCIETMILDTRLVPTERGARQIASHDLSRYLLDGDLSNLGSDDFFERAELMRRELGVARGLFFHQVRTLLEHHEWLTEAGRNLRQDGQARNMTRLLKLLEDIGENVKEEPGEEIGLGLNQVLFLSKLPLLLNSSLDTQKITSMALEHLKSMLGAEAATVFILEPDAKELTFWALQGEQTSRLEGLKMPAGKGIVGWVIEHQESVLIEDVEKDPRFFSDVDHEGGFTTRNLMCVPLTVKGDRQLGAVQVLNKKGGEDFTANDLLFVEQFGHQLSLALDNARLFEDLVAKSQDLETLDRRKNEMISVIGHEFRTPLNVIQTSADMLASGMLQDEDSLKKMAATLQRGVSRLTRLITEIRNVSYVSDEKLKIQVAPIEVEELLENTAKQFLEPLRERKLDLDVQIADDVDKLQGDESLVIILLDNLISNAIRFTDDGGKVSLVASKSAGFVEIAVEDTGIGIEDSQRDVIFEKFYEVVDVMEHSSGEFGFKSAGLGLGLSTVRAILEAHGASIDVDSELGKGSIFRFRLPAAE